MRALAALLFVAGTAGAAGPAVDLDAPGVMQALRDADPACYDKIQAILVIAATVVGRFQQPPR